LPDTYRDARIGRPASPLLLSGVLALFTGTLFADIAYAGTYDVTWATFSTWLLAGAEAAGAIAAIVGIVDLSRRRVRANRLIWPYALAYAVAMVLGLFNNFVHSRDAYTSVVPTGLTLSVITEIVLLACVAMAVPMMYTRRTGVAA
jgi:uncharacterized membrane protein